MSGTSATADTSSVPVIHPIPQTSAAPMPMMLDVRELDPRTPVLLADGVVLSADMVRYIWWRRRNDCSASCIACHFQDYWNVEIGQRTVEHALRNELQPTSRALPYGYIDILTERITLPAGIFYDVAGCYLNETESVIFYIHRRYGYLLVHDEVVALITQWESTLPNDADGLPIYPHLNNIRPRPDGRHHWSLPTTPLTPRLGRPRTSFEIPPPRYSPPPHHGNTVLRHQDQINPVGEHLPPFFPIGLEPRPPTFGEIEHIVDQPPVYEEPEDPETTTDPPQPPVVPETDPPQPPVDGEDSNTAAQDGSSTATPLDGADPTTVTQDGPSTVTTSSPVVSTTNPDHSEASGADNSTGNGGDVTSSASETVPNDSDAQREFVDLVQNLQTGQETQDTRVPIVTTTLPDPDPVPAPVPDPAPELSDAWIPRPRSIGPDAISPIVLLRDPDYDYGPHRPLVMLADPAPPIDKESRWDHTDPDVEPSDPDFESSNPQPDPDPIPDSPPSHNPHDRDDRYGNAGTQSYFVLASYETRINMLATDFPVTLQHTMSNDGFHLFNRPAFTRLHGVDIPMIVVLDGATFSGIHAQTTYELQLSATRFNFPDCFVVMITWPGDVLVVLESPNSSDYIPWNLHEDAAFRRILDTTIACRNIVAPWDWDPSRMPRRVNSATFALEFSSDGGRQEDQEHEQPDQHE